MTTHQPKTREPAVEMCIINTPQTVDSIDIGINQRCTTGDPLATWDQRPLVTKFAKLFVNLLVVTRRLFNFFAPKNTRK